MDNSSGDTLPNSTVPDAAASLQVPSPTQQQQSEIQQPSPAQNTQPNLSNAYNAMPTPNMPNNSKLKKLFIAGGVLLLVIAVFAGFTYLSYTRTRQAGIDKVQSFVTKLESGDKDQLQSDVLGVIGISPTTTDPAEIQKISKIAVQTAIVSRAAKDKKLSLYKTDFGGDKSTKMVTRYYEIDESGQKAYYSIRASKTKDSDWRISRLELSKTRL